MPTNDETQALSFPVQWYVLWWLIVIFHMATWLGLTASCIFSLIYQPLYVTFPIWAFCVYLLTTDDQCPVTRWENLVRDRLGWPHVPHFTHWYVICPVLHGRTCNRKCAPVAFGPK